MKKLLLFSVIFLTVSGSVFAQAVRFSGTVTQKGTIGTVTNAVLLPANPTVAVCIHPANAVPCTNKATTFTDPTAATACSQTTQIVLGGTTTCVAAPDANDNFGFWALPSALGYDYTVTIGAQTFGPFNVLSQTTTHSQTETFTNQTNNLCAINGVFTIDTNNTCGWSGADPCAKAMSAYAAASSSGGKISVSPGTYTCSTALSFTTGQKPVTFTCQDGISTNNPVTAAPALFKFTGTGAFLTLNGSFMSKIQGCAFAGPDGVSGSTASGITVGGSSLSAVTTLDHVDISGFGNGGLVFGNNAFVFKCDTCSIHDNGPSGGQNIIVPSSLVATGENMSFKNGQIYSSAGNGISPTCINFLTGGDFNFDGVSIDNCLITINNLTGNTNLTLMGSTHMETNSSTAADYIQTGASAQFATITFAGVSFRENNSSARTEFIKDGSTVPNHNFLLNVLGLNITSGETVTNFFQPGSQCCPVMNLFGLNNFNGSITNLISSTGAATNVVMSDGLGDLQFGFSGKLITLVDGSLAPLSVSVNGGGAPPITVSSAGRTQNMVSNLNWTSQKAETGTADANVLTFTPNGTAGNYRVCFAASVSSATSGVIGWTLSWTDSNGNAQSNIAQSLFRLGTAAPALTFTTSAAGNYSSCTPIDVNNAGANIVIKWVGGGTTAAKVSATVERII